MQKNFFIILSALLIMTLLYSCYDTEVLPHTTEIEAKEAQSSFRNTEEVSTSSFNFEVGETYVFSSLSADGSQTHKLSLTLDEDGNLSVSQSNVAVQTGDIRNSNVNAEGVLISEDQKKTFVGNANQDYWVIPFDGDAPFLRSGGAPTVFLITCDCKKVEGHTPNIGDCSAVASSDGNGGYSVTCNNVGCSKCDWNTNSSIVNGNVLIVSHPSINTLSVE